MPNKHGNGNGNGNENFAAALAEVSDRLTKLVQDEIELAKAEVTQKTKSLARGAAAVAAGAVFGIFAVVFFLLTLAWVLDGIFVSGAGSLWLGFLIVLVILLILTVAATMFAWRAFSVGAPTPKMAIYEGKKIKETVTTMGGSANGHGTPTPATEYPARSFASIAQPAVAAATVIEPASTPEVSPTAPAPEVSSPAAADPSPWPEPPTGTPEPAPTPSLLEPTAPTTAPESELPRTPDPEPPSTPDPEPTPGTPEPASSAPESAPAAAPTSPGPEAATDAAPRFVTLPDESPTTEHAIPSPDGGSDEVEQVREDADDSPGPEN